MMLANQGTGFPVVTLELEMALFVGHATRRREADLPIGDKLDRDIRQGDAVDLGGSLHGLIEEKSLLAATTTREEQYETQTAKPTPSCPSGHRI
jgi:hypothetical protein